MQSAVKYAIAVLASLMLGLAFHSAIAASYYAGGNETVFAQDGETVSVTLKTVGPNKVKVIKIVRTYLDLDLRAAKDLVDSAEKSPVVLTESLDAEKAAKMKAELEEVGAKVILK